MEPESLPHRSEPNGKREADVTFMKRLFVGAFLVIALVPIGPSAQQQPPQSPPPSGAPAPVQAPGGVFRSRREVITVDAIVRDKSGAIVRGLTAEDFEIREDGRPQQVLNFSFEEIKDKAPARVETADLLAGVEAKLQEQTRSPSSVAAAQAAPPADVPTSESMAGRRLITLLEHGKYARDARGEITGFGRLWIP